MSVIATLCFGMKWHTIVVTHTFLPVILCENVAQIFGVKFSYKHTQERDFSPIHNFSGCSVLPVSLILNFTSHLTTINEKEKVNQFQNLHQHIILRKYVKYFCFIYRIFLKFYIMRYRNLICEQIPLLKSLSLEY